MTGPRLPSPYAPPDLDVRALPEMPLAVGRLIGSDAAARLSADAFRAAVLLWCEAWHQVPAGTLPDDEIQLAKLAGLGRDLATWRGLAEEALHGFTLCRDLRWHHELIVDLAVRERSALRARQRLSELNSAKGRRRQAMARALSGRAAQAAAGYDPADPAALDFTLVDAAGNMRGGTIDPAAAAQAVAQAAAAPNGGKTATHNPEQEQSDSSRGSTAVPAAADETPPSPPSSLSSPSVSPLKNPPSTPPPLSPSTPSTPELAPGSSATVGVAAVDGDLLGDLPAGSVKVRRSSATPPPCPVEKILEIYHAELPQLPAVRVLPEQVRKYVTTRWREDVERQSLGWWRGYFRHVATCPFLVGGTRHAFHASFEWLVRPLNFAKVVNGNYDREETPAGGER